jgi:hypothetical protein
MVGNFAGAANGLRRRGDIVSQALPFCYLGRHGCFYFVGSSRRASPT